MKTARKRVRKRGKNTPQEGNVSRTDELKKGGKAKQVSGGGNNAPFVKWADGYGFVEGVFDSMWESQYGMVATVEVEGCQNVQGSAGKEEPLVAVEEGQTVNVGLQYSALSGVTEKFVGHRVHIAFEGWEKSRQGNNYRVFSVLDLGAVEGRAPQPEAATSPPSEKPQQSVPAGSGPGAPGAETPPPPAEDDLPF